jgi:hypothetical protein
MKHKNILRMFGVAVILTLLIAVLPVATALATGSISLNSTQGKVGDVISFTASGWPTITDDAEYAVDIYFSDQSAALTGAIGGAVTRYRYLNTFELQVNGSFTGSFTVPSTINEGTLGVSQPVTVTASTTYYLYATNRYDVGGAAPSTALNAVASLTITAGATLDALVPASGIAGTSVQITGANFPASATIVVQFDGSVIAIASGDTVTRSSGLLISTIVVPSTAATGSHTIKVTAGTGSATATFTVTANPAIETMLPETGPAGTQVTITGISFPANTALAFKFNNTDVAISNGSTQTGSGGSFASVITIPTGVPAGAYNITVTAGAGTASKTFTVTAPATTTTQPPTETTTTPPVSTTTTTPPPSATAITLNKSGDFVGASIGIGGSGFKKNGTVTLKYDDKTVGTAPVDASGFFVATFAVPASAHGEHTITATDGTNTNTTTFELESDPPKIPVPLSPAMGASIKSPLKFDWEDVTDESSPVTYRFQIATSSNFAANTIVIDKSGITKSEYTLTDIEELRLTSDENKYYWREEAVDAAQNESGWTGAGEFSVSQPFKFTGWPMIVVIIVGAVVMWLFGFWIGRKTAFYY